MKILISGATGLVGSALVSKLKSKGHDVRKLVRKKSHQPDEFYWNYTENQIDESAFGEISSIIHLAGASIAKRWTESYKKEIISSRVASANFLQRKCEEKGIRLKSFISASGTNYYGTYTSNEILYEENTVKHSDFLSDVCEKWENAAHAFAKTSEKVVILRTSPVFSEKGGSFESLKKIIDFNLGSGVGSGKQWFNWIHLEDLVNLYVEAVEKTEVQGIYNAVADEVPTNTELMKRLAKASGKLFIPINVPKIVLQLALGEMSEMILEGTRVSNEKLKKQGFQFQYPDLDSALKNLLRN